tara:strand:- start:389 stop:616 length:228 start_codon:yes stop_codon:yes gene_type:complete
MTLNIGQWGNSLGVRIPRIISEKLNLTKGAEIEIFESEGRIIIKKKENLRDLLANSSPCPYGEIKTDQPIGNEEW